MLSPKWFTSFSIITVFGLFIFKIALNTEVLAKDTVLLRHSPSSLLKTISPNLITQRQAKMALVIGNANYEEGALANPVNDATDVAQALRDLGFEVTLLQNQDLRSMEDAVENFSRQLRKDGVGVFYFAGHGIQIGGENYLIPLKAKLLREKDVRYEGLALGKVLNAMSEGENHVNIVIIDACRDNPFYRRWLSTQRSSNFVRGLAKVDLPPQGTVLAFAAASNQYAEDGNGRNSPFTSNLLRYIKEPNLDIVLMFRKVREGVLNDTQKQQEPWYQESLVGGSFYFNEVAALPPKPIPITTSKPNPSNVATPKPSQQATVIKNNLSQKDIISILQGIPVFTIADSTGAPLVAVDNNKKIMSIFISQQEAQKFFQQLKKDKPNIASKVTVQPVALSEVYKLAIANTNKPNSLNFAYVPVPAEVTNAKELLTAEGKKYEGGVPLYVARGGKEYGYLTIEQNNEPVVPFFFEKKQIQEMVDRFKKEKPDLASTVKIDVVPLENLLATLQQSNDPMLGQIRLVPTEESLKFINDLKGQK